MNCQQIEQHWDDARDAALPPQDQQAFDDHIKQCERCSSLYHAETAWLNTLGESDADTVVTSDAFIEKVLDQWDSQQLPGAVIGRIGWDVIRVAAVAAAMLLLSVSIWFAGRTDIPVEPTPPVVVRTECPAAALVSNVSLQYEEGTGLIGKSIDRTREALKIENVFAFIDVSAVPDPAEYVEKN